MKNSRFTQRQETDGMQISFKIKYNVDWSIEKYRIRLVVKDYT